MHCVGAMVGDGDIEELGARMCGVVDLMLSRLKADLNADLLRIALCAFDMHMVRKGFCEREHGESAKRACKRGLVKVAMAMRVDPTQALVEYNSGVAMLLRNGTQVGLTTHSLDNRIQWASLLTSDGPTLPLFGKVVRFYVRVLEMESVRWNETLV